MYIRRWVKQGAFQSSFLFCLFVFFVCFRFIVTIVTDRKIATRTNNFRLDLFTHFWGNVLEQLAFHSLKLRISYLDFAVLDYTIGCDRQRPFIIYNQHKCTAKTARIVCHSAHLLSYGS